LTIEWLGYIAGALITCSLVPQIIRVFKLKSAREISTLFTVLMFVGTGLWLAYGIIIRRPSMILWNSIAGALIGVLLYGKLRYGK
jgi:MtN3 and saliva related transmembrane protein